MTLDDSEFWICFAAAILALTGERSLSVNKGNRAAHRDQPRDEESLILEWSPDAEAPTHYWFSHLPVTITRQKMIRTVMGRWRIERDDEDLKQEVGLGHFEGRNWRGFHHQASLCTAA